MLFSTLQVILMPMSFGLLLALMLLYWGQAAIFSYTKYNKLTTICFFSSIITLTLLLICRALDSGHLPLSNLYESLLFLSWSFLIIQFILQINIQSKNTLTSENHTEKKVKALTPLIANAMYNGNTSGSDFSISEIKQSDISEMKKNTLVKSKENSVLLRPQSQYDYKNQLCTNQAGESFCEETTRSYYPQLMTSYYPESMRVLVEDQLTNLLGVITSPISLLTYSFAFLNLPKEMQKSTSLVPALQSNWLMMHVTVMILSYAALLCGSILSMAFLFFTFLEKRQLKDEKKKNSVLVRDTETESVYSPSLSLVEKLDNYSYRILSLGFPLLTVGILSGAVWANQAWGSYWSWDPKESWALITWLIFAIYLHARITKGWSGEKPAIIATFGFFVVWFCYLGVNLLGTGLHSYGWFSN